MKLDLPQTTTPKPNSRAGRGATHTVNVNIVKKVYNQTFKGVFKGNMNFEK